MIVGYLGRTIQRRTSFTFEECIGKYNFLKVGDEEKLMVVVDRLKTLIQRLASLGNIINNQAN
jgi:hypothetical protein